LAKKTVKSAPSVKIIPLGGIGEIGKNMTAIECGNDILVIDCGLAFPREDMPGVDYIIPDTTYLEQNREKVRAFVITHGHEDHIGAAPYVFPKFDGVPVYATKLAQALMETKFQEQGVEPPLFLTAKAGGEMKRGVFRVEFIKVSHSIEDSIGLAIHTPAGVLVHTGDFKIDYTPVGGKQIDLNKFAELGSHGVLALMSDSTNAEKPGFTISERSVGEAFENYFEEAKGRIVIATFSSNIHRLQQVIDTAKRYNRKICFTGRSMLKIVEVASNLGYLRFPSKMRIDMDEIDSVRDNKLVILTTGSQGEPMSGLVRMAAGEHPKMQIKEGDTVIISATPIPGNERYVYDVINMLYNRGAKVAYGSMAQVHVSGHACQEELKLMLSLIKPKYFIPVHGEARHLFKHAGLADAVGIENVFIPELGKVIEISETSGRIGEEVPYGSVLIDGLGVGDVGNVVLRDRQVLSRDGLFVIIMTIDKNGRHIVADPEIISRGFVYMRESEDLMEEAKQLVVKTLENCQRNRITDWMTIKGRVKKAVSGLLYTKTKRSPMILPVIIEV